MARKMMHRQTTSACAEQAHLAHGLNNVFVVVRKEKHAAALAWRGQLPQRLVTCQSQSAKLSRQHSVTRSVYGNGAQKHSVHLLANDAVIMAV